MAGRRSSGTKKSNRILKQINYNAAGIDAGAAYHFVAVPEERATPTFVASPPQRAGYTSWQTGWPSAAWIRWRSRPQACTAFRCWRCWKYEV